MVRVMTVLYEPPWCGAPHIWFNYTRMHLCTYVHPESLGRSGISEYADGMLEHDGHVHTGPTHDLRQWEIPPTRTRSPSAVTMCITHR